MKLLWLVAFIQLLLIDVTLNQELPPSESESGDVGPSQPVVTVNPGECSYTSVLEARESTTPKVGVEPTVGLLEAIMIFFGVGIMASLIAMGFHSIRKHFYGDSDSLDTSFDAGGKVSIGLTATTIVSQWTWSATLLQSSTVAARYGVSGPYWYAGGATIQIVLFAILSIQLKTRAPGAKTFLQVIRARFGKKTHIVFCVFAFFTNLIVMISLTIAGTAVLNSLVKDLSVELSAMALAIIMGGYTLIGGLGATFYVSYFNTSLIFIMILMLIVEIFYNPFDNPENPFGSSDRVYQFVNCWNTAPEGNAESSYLTFFSSGGLIFGIVNIIGNFGTVFCDQAYWQSSVAAKPLQGVWGFISGGLTWFAIPFSMATTMGLAYLGLSSSQGAAMLNIEDVDRGLVAPLVAQKLLGTTGEYTILFLLLMAIMSTGSAEIIAIASIIIYDIYQIYIEPFRPELKDGECILCGKPMREDRRDPDRILCHCSSVVKCEPCKVDSKVREQAKGLVKPHHKCDVHGAYRDYLEHLLHYKNWCIVWTTFMVIPLCLVCHVTGLNLAWTYYFTGILISSSVVPIALSIMWAKVNSKGMIAGVTGGCICGMISWLSFASTYEGGLGNFLENTGQNLPMLTGNCVSIGAGGFFAILVSFITNWNQTEEEVEEEWHKTRDIDNPLNPWVEVYKREMAHKEGMEGGAHHARPPLAFVEEKFRRAKYTAYIAGTLLTIVFVGVWPASMTSFTEMNITGFLVWTSISRGWAFVAATFIILVPLIQEIKAILKQHRRNREKKEEGMTMQNINNHCKVSSGHETNGKLPSQGTIDIKNEVRCGTENDAFAVNAELNR